MSFPKKKTAKIIRDILSKYLNGNEEEFKECTDKIVTLIKGHFNISEDYRRQRDNALIALQDRKDMGY